MLTCLTVQHQTVLNTILENGIYIASLDRTILLLQELYKKMMYYLNYINCPIFLGMVGRKTDMFGAAAFDTDEHYKTIMHDGYCVMQFNIPDGQYNLQNYYHWDEVIAHFDGNKYDCKLPNYVFNGTIEDYIRYALIEEPPNRHDVTQVTTQVLLKEWLVDYTTDADIMNILCQEQAEDGGCNILHTIEDYRKQKEKS